MPDVLDQSEVDALLDAVEGGDIAADTAGEVIVVGDVSLYDFKRPEKVSKDQARSFETLHEFFARNLSGSLSSYLRAIVEVRLVSVEELAYSEFIMSLPSPTCFNILSCEPLDGNMVLEINPTIIYPIIDRLLGGGKSYTTIPDRPLTEIELNLVNTLLDRALEQLKACWTNIKVIDFKVTQTESNPLLMQVIAPNEPVVLICFEMTMGEFTGTMNFCIPYRVIEPVIGEFASHAYYGLQTKRARRDFTADIKGSLSRAALDFTAFVAETKITVKDLLELQVGDIIDMEREADLPMVIFIEGLPKYIGKAGIFKGQRAVQILGKADQEDPFVVISE
jgi:flagellar motor switch protein FliM